MKEQIQDLIAHGRVEEALNLLVQSNSDALMLQARYSNGKKQYNMGLIQFDEWQRVQNQINFAILEMAMTSKTTNVNFNTNISTTNITVINFDSAKSFAESLEKIDLKILVDQITKELIGNPAMKAWLPLKQEYDSFALLGTPIPPGYLTELKSKLIKIYDEYWTNAKAKESEKISSAIQAIYNSLCNGKDESIIREAITDFQIFFYENPKFSGLTRMNELEESLKSPKMKLFKENRPQSFTEELEKIHLELVEVSNRIISNIEK